MEDLWTLFANVLSAVARVRAMSVDKYRWLPRDYEDGDQVDVEWAEIKPAWMHDALPIADLLTLCELLLRDEKVFSCALLMWSSLNLHSFCLHCEYRNVKKQPYAKHKHDEIDDWRMALMLADLEPAVVQAMRIAESIFGELSQKDLQDSAKKYKLTNKLSGTGIDLSSKFIRDGSNLAAKYVEFYDKYRNPSAHGYKLDKSRLTRKQATEVQILGAQVLLAVISTRRIATDTALAALQVNKSAVTDLDKLINSWP